MWAITWLLDKYDGDGPAGTFSAAVTARVKDFQSHFGLTSDGIVGPVTWRHLVFHYEQPDNFLVICKGLSNGVDTFGYATDAWGTAQSVNFLEYAGNAVFVLYNVKVAFRDLSRDHGGEIPDHGSHEVGMDVDIRPMSNTSYHCDNGLTYQSTQYNLQRTIYLAISLQDASNFLGNDLHRVTFFNDQQVIDEVDEVEMEPMHDDHLHARFCTEYHPFDARYDCVN